MIHGESPPIAWVADILQSQNLSLQWLDIQEGLVNEVEKA